MVALQKGSDFHSSCKQKVKVIVIHVCKGQKFLLTLVTSFITTNIFFGRFHHSKNKKKTTEYIYFHLPNNSRSYFRQLIFSHHLMWLFLIIIVLHNNVFIWLEEETDVDEWPWETHTVDLPVKSIKHFYCDKYWQSHSHWMKVTKHLTLSTNKVWWICRALHVVCLNKNKTKDIFSSNQN